MRVTTTLLGLALAACASRGGPPTSPAAEACNQGAPPAEGEAMLEVGGVARRYVVRLPAGYPSGRAWPLVLALHPNGGGLDFWDDEMGPRSIRALARQSAVVVLPLARPAAAGGFDWRGDLPADLAYFDALVARLQATLCLDRRRIFAMGFSGGGSFSGVLACRRHDIRAFASGSGIAYYDPKDCAGPVPAWFTVGADELIPARAQYRDDWLARNGCQPATDPPTAGTCESAACPAATPVVFCVHPGDHFWPDDATAAAWSFFQRF